MAETKFDCVFAQVSFQFCGHLDEYLISRTRHLGLVYMQTRFGRGNHLFRRYENGRLAEERELKSSSSLLGYYGRWLWHWHRELWRFARSHGPLLVVVGFPLEILGRFCHRRARYVYWQWDYFPGRGLPGRLFNLAAAWAIRRCDEYRALSSAIGKAMGCPEARVVMLGVTPSRTFGDRNSRRLLMVGQLRHGQGVESVLDFLATHPQYELSLMGAAANGFEYEIRRRLETLELTQRVYFPNRFVTEAELCREAAKCMAALALYDLSPDNLTHYADPGKVKNAIEMGLPVVMTRISDIVPFVTRFHAGEVIDSLAELPQALARIRADPEAYFRGCRQFGEYFDWQRYYDAEELLGRAVNGQAIAPRG